MRNTISKICSYRLCVFFCTLFTVLIACSNTQVKEQKDTRTIYTCLDHGSHHYEDRASLCACLGIEEKRYKDFRLFEKESSTKNKDDLTHLQLMLKEKLADQLVTIIINRLQAAFGEEVTTRWQLENTSFPVLFRTFVRFDGSLYHIKVIAATEKKNFEARFLIRFLPLEYKMNFMQPSEEELKLLLP